MTTPETCESSVQPHPHREQFYTPRTEYGRYAQGRAPHSPASIDNSDLMMMPGPAMPRYGRSVSFEEQENHQPLGSGFSCGVGLALESSEGFIHRPQPRSTNFNRTYPRASSASDPSAVSLTASFDGVDFRTGLSGHRGLSHARKLQNSPKPRSQIMMMSEHRGIAHIRPSHSRNGIPVSSGTPPSSSTSLTIFEDSPTFSATVRPHSSIPALGPRFSSPSHSS